MLQQTADAAPAEDQAGEARRRRSAAALGPAVARICGALGHGDLIFVACSEQRAEAMAAAVQALSDALVLWCPPHDAFPGEDAPSSPAVAGRRVAALSALHERGERPVLLVTDAAAAAQKLAAPAAFKGLQRIVEPGQEIEGEALAGELEAFGYFRDDRVDEPGEMAIRGGAIDLFPADAEKPVRIHLEGGRVERISAYDPVSQLGSHEQIERLIIRPAIEPAPGADAVTIFDHLAGAVVALDPEAEDRRDRFIELVEEAAARKGKAALAGDAA
ncbi:MAG: DEAD/DEAH box helicase, partial [Pseudomonadota bacterium]|nr:DEAD/DEAH box helicase [Pseudomonadota bacterium]